MKHDETEPWVKLEIFEQPQETYGNTTALNRLGQQWHATRPHGHWHPGHPEDLFLGNKKKSETSANGRRRNHFWLQLIDWLIQLIDSILASFKMCSRLIQCWCLLDVVLPFWEHSTSKWLLFGTKAPWKGSHGPHGHIGHHWSHGRGHPEVTTTRKLFSVDRLSVP